jgi:PEGA domain
MIRHYRVLQCGSLLLHLRSGPSLVSPRLEVRQVPDAPTHRHASLLLPPSFLLFLLLCLAPGLASGQAVVEAGGATSVSATAGSAAKMPPFPSDATLGDKSKSPHLLASIAQRPEIANRQTLEQNAGKHPGKLLLRSIPSGAQIWVNGMFAGHAPLLLIVAPGKYQLEFRGQRMEHAVHTVDLLPDETRTVSLPLSARYPTRASVR